MGDNMDTNIVHKQKKDILNIDSILLSDDINKALEVRLKTPITTKIEIKLDTNKLYDMSILEKISVIDPSITIIYGFEDVNIITFIKVMKSLDNMVKPIINTNLSIFEKYLYVYNVTTHFKQYKDQVCREDDALSLFRIFEPNNDLIVCGGFSKILFELCKRINIKNKLISADAYEIAYEEYKKTRPHVRNISRITDEKYNIDGIYINDATWDNDLDNELYTTALLTPYESISAYDTNIGIGSHDIFSVQSYDEFLYQLDKDSKNEYKVFKQTFDYIIYFYPEIIDNLNKINSYYNYSKLENKTYEDYKILLSDNEFTNYIFNFIYDKCNKRISGKTIISALTNILKTLYPNISDKEIDRYITKVTKANYDKYDDLFLISKEYDKAYCAEYLTKESKNKFK